METVARGLHGDRVEVQVVAVKAPGAG